MTTKYHSQKIGKYASKRESRRASELSLMQACQVVTELEEQVKYVLIPKQDGERAVTYTADFRYRENGKLVVEDCKGFATQVWVIKRKLMLYVHGIRILVT